MLRKKFFKLLKKFKWSVIVPAGAVLGFSVETIDQKTKLPGFLRELNKKLNSRRALKRAAKRNPLVWKAAQLRKSISEYKKLGELTKAAEALAELSLLARKGTASDELAWMQGRLRELNVNWFPRIPGTRRGLVESPERICICHLHKVAYPEENTGGAIRNLNIVRSQRQLGLEPYVILPTGYPAKAPEGIELLQTIDNVPFFYIKPNGWRDKELPPDKSLLYDTFATASILAKQTPDIIHASSGFRGYELALKGLALKKHFGIPLVYEVRSFHEHTWSKPFDGIMDAEHTRLRVAQENRCMRESDHVVTISDSMREKLIERGVPPEMITVVPNGIDTERYLNRRPTRGKGIQEAQGIYGGRTIGVVSNMSWREGHSITLAATKQLLEEFPDTHCLFVGDGPMRKELEKEARRLGIGSRVKFVGEVDNSRIDDYYEAIDVFIVPRRKDYASDYVTPLKPFEAMALKRPIIVSDRPALKEIAGDEERGLVFSTGDSGHLAEKVATLFRNSALEAELIDNAYQWVMEERSWKRNAERYLNIYERLLTGRV